MTRIVIDRAARGELSPALLDSMFRLRCEVFHARLQWDVAVADGREHDRFDTLSPYYVIASPRDEPARSIGCCRLLPSTGPNMLRDVFPYLADQAPIPARPDVWEISRFAIAEGHGAGAFGFGDVPAAMLRAAAAFAAGCGVSALVGVTSAPVERLLRHMAFEVERLGVPRRVGKVMSLAFRLPLHDAVLARIGATCRTELAIAA